MSGLNVQSGSLTWSDVCDRSHSLRADSLETASSVPTFPYLGGEEESANERGCVSVRGGSGRDQEDLACRMVCRGMNRAVGGRVLSCHGREANGNGTGTGIARRSGDGLGLEYQGVVDGGRGGNEKGSETESGQGGPKVRL